MTGYIGPGTVMPLSWITGASLADIGYTVNLAMADPFAPTSSALAATAAASGGNSASIVKSATSRPPSIATEIRRPSWEASVDNFFAERDPLELLAG